MIKDTKYKSELHTQYHSISQEYPLSKFLFCILIAVLVYDTKNMLDADHSITLSTDIDIHELLYTDDILLMDISSSNLQVYIECIAKYGKFYDISFNSNNLEVLPVRYEGYILNEHKDEIINKSNIKYLGAMLSSNGRISSELSRRISMADQDFSNLYQS